MTLSIAAFAFGGILLLTAIVGGGFELEKLKIPKGVGFPGWWPRWWGSYLSSSGSD